MVRDRMTAQINSVALRKERGDTTARPRTPSSESLLCAGSFFGRLRAGCEWLEFREAWGLDVFGLFRTLVIIVKHMS